jgi:hypothetical protein
MPEFKASLRTPRLPSAPVSPIAGEMYYDTGTSTLYWWNGTSWISSKGAPPIYEQPAQPTEPIQIGSLWVDNDASPPLGPTGPTGPAGPTGPQGATGPGVPVGGVQGQALVKKTATDFDTQWAQAGADLVYDGDFAAGPTYKDGEVVIYNGIAYICVTPTTAAPVAWPGGPPAVPAYPRPGYGVTLPATPVDAQEYILVDSLTNPSYQWHFRYNAASTSAYKWEFVGGVPYVYPMTTIASWTAINQWVILVGWPVPRAGDYIARAQFYSALAGTPAGTYIVYVGVGVQNSISAGTGTLYAAAGAWQTISGADYTVLNMVAGNYIQTMGYSGQAMQANATIAQLTITPKRVS